MAKKCAVCGGKIPFFLVELDLSKEHRGTYVCDPCDNLLRGARKGDKRAFDELSKKSQLMLWAR